MKKNWTERIDVGGKWRCYPQVCSRKSGVRRLAVVAALASAICALAFGDAVAWGTTGHVFASSLREAPLGTALVEPFSVAVDVSNGTVFVGDAGGGFVDVYGASGAYVARFGGGSLFVSGVAVDEASGDVYVADSFSDSVVVFRPDGAGGYVLLSEWFGEHVAGGEFGEVTGIAVDNSHGMAAGDVYVVDGRSRNGGAGVVDVFEPKPAGSEEALEGGFVRSLTSGKMEAPNGVAVSRSTGRVLVADSAKGTVYAFDATGVLEEKLSGKGSPFGSFGGKEEAGNVAGVAVDELSGDVYVAEAERHLVSQYSANGVWEGSIAATPGGGLGEPRSVALAADGDVYVADAGLAVVDRFGPGVVVPDVETGKIAKSAIARASAVLSGTVNGEGKPSSYRFQYGENEALGSETTTQSAGTGEQTVSATVEKLNSGTSYFYRIVGENADGTSYGVIREFATSPAVGGLETGTATNVAPQGVTLAGSLKRGGLETRYFFQYGTSTDYGKQGPEPAGEVPPAGEAKEEKLPKTVQTQLAELSVNTLYHYRLVAENSYGTTYGQDRIFTTSGPPAITSEPVSGLSQHEVTLQAQINPDQLATTYHFEYGETNHYGEDTTPASAGSGTTYQAVTAALAGLKLDSTYHYRLVAENEAGTTTGPDEVFMTVSSATIDETYATGLTASEAILHTQINPLGNDTRYYFQYGTQPCQANPNACTDTPTPPGNDIGAATSDTEGQTTLTSLQPATTYHYRVIASNTLGTTNGPEQTLTTQTTAGSFALPDGRAWEMVTPPDKAGAPVEALTREGGLILAAENGDSLAYVVNGALGEEVPGNRSPEMQQILATRTPTGWTSQDVASPNSQAKGVTAGQAPEYQFFAPDLSVSLVEPPGKSPEPPLAPGVTQATGYLRDDLDGTYIPLLTEADVAPGVTFGDRVHFVSASSDLSHVVLISQVALTGGRSRPGLYEWSEGKLQYVSVLPGGKPAYQPEPELGYLHDPANAISLDGSRVIWTLPSGTAEASRGHLYMRDTVRGETIELDAAQGVAEPHEGSAQFQTASSDGSRVFFTDSRRLTPDSPAELPQGEGKPDLYECEMLEEDGRLVCRLRDLTVASNSGEHASVQGLIFGASQDGTNLYLVAQGVIASNVNGSGEAAEAGADNLYALRLAGGQWARTFIARLSSSDKAEWEGAKLANTAYLTARVSPDGRYLAFMSAAPITGYDNVDSSSAANGARDEEVYLYDSATASLRCVSCDPDGTRPAGVLDTIESGEGLGLLVDRREIWLGRWLAGNIPGWTAQSLPTPQEPGALFQSRYLSDTGRLYFNSPDHLVPAATSGKENVYQYEPSGIGSCQSQTGGCVSLLSNGTSSHESAFLEATPDGGNVFFLTEAHLLSQDTDTAFDIYDARECAQGSPCLTPLAAQPAACEEMESCRPAQPSQQIPSVAPATATSSGSGNLAPSTTTIAAKHATEAKKASKLLTTSQKLKAALASCHRRYPHAKKRRMTCERKARERYRDKHTAKKAGRTPGSGR